MPYALKSGGALSQPGTFLVGPIGSRNTRVRISVLPLPLVFQFQHWCSMTKRRDYCFTINNYTDEDLDALLVLQAAPNLKYLICGKEKGEEGTPHIQGYVYFKNPVVFATVKAFLPRAHIEATKGSVDQNIEYCSKEGDFLEHGERPVSQKRKGELGAEFWAAQLELAKKGRIHECDPKIQITHDLALHRIAVKHAPMPADADGPTGLWYYGDTGTGKSRTARTQNPGAYLKMCNKWWDGYDNEEVVIIEDFDASHNMLGHHLKIWADRYAFPAEVKGGKINIRPKTILVTSNYHPDKIWVDPNTLNPILRRFRIVHFSINNPYQI